MENKKYLKNLFVIAAIILSVAFAGGCATPAADEPAPSPEAAAPAPDSEPELKSVEIEPEPEPEPEPEAHLPLNGEGVDADDPRLLKRPLSVKIENTPQSRPSMGLTYADVVYETLTEGGITRFNAIFHSRIPAEAGSVRSARNSDLSIVPQYDALFAFSGTNAEVWQGVRAIIRSHISEGNAGGSFYRVDQKYAPHNLYYNPSAGYERFEELGHDIYIETPRGLIFGENDLESLGGERAEEIFVPFSAPAFDVTWKYDPGAGAYFRYINGEAQVDESDLTKQVKAENVVILSAMYLSGGGNGTYILNLNGEGDAVLFQDGMRVEATWQTDGSHPPILKSQSGETINFKPGQTWFQVPGNFSAVEVIR